MQPDKVAASTSFDSIKNFDTQSRTATFSGSLAPGATATRTVTFLTNRTEDVVTNLLINYSGATNDSSHWKQGFGPIVWGSADLIGAGTQSIKVFVKVSNTRIAVDFTLFNFDSVSRTINTVNITVKSALYAVDFTL